MIDETKLIEEILEHKDRIKSRDKRVDEVYALAHDHIIDIINIQPKTDWIPFEQREADEEEKEYWLENYGQEIEYMLCCKLPDEDEEILVTYANGNVGEDIFLRDGYECYLDSGNEFVTEAIAWMPKPQPYKKEGAENEL